MAGRPPLVAGNWKMNGLRASAAELTRVAEGARGLAGRAELMICPPATLLREFAGLARGSPLQIGAQDCHSESAGAFTGDLSAEMLRDAGACAVIVGHSERRTHHCETDAMVRAKAMAACRAGLTGIVCIGETAAERDAGRATAVVGAQLDASLPGEANAETVVIAYEPVWAIGSGVTPNPEQVAEMHGFIRKRLRTRFDARADGMRILYGGSVNAANAGTLLHVVNVDGALVGGASLKADEFLAIAAVYG